MKHLYFVTSNSLKFTEVSSQLPDICPGVKIDQMQLDVPEIQSEDPTEILRQKVDYIQSKTSLPFIVDDTSFDTVRYPGFPGSYAKFINSTIGRIGIERLFDQGDGIRAIARIALCYLGTTRYFEGSISGKLDFSRTKHPTDNNLMSDIMYVSPDVSLRESTQTTGFNNHRSIAISKLGEWLNSQDEYEIIQKVNTEVRWNQRASGWRDMIEDTNSYVNFEKNYSRVNTLIKKYAPLAKGKALEIGCGTGEAGRILKQANPALDVLSTDIAGNMLHEAERQTRERELSIRYKQADIVKDSFDGEKFGIILSRGVVISHIPRGDIIDYLESITRHTEAGGYFLFDFIQSVLVGDVEKPIDPKNEFTINQLDNILSELGWNRIDNSGTDKTRVRVVCYKKGV
ncbi:MAG: non-canonical purine NTP pyrophosphatase [Candidatus Saccharimonadales bacterium]